MGNVGEIEEIQWLSSPDSTTATLPLLSLNHVSFVCKSVSKSVGFYEQVLGFVLIKRPSSFNFEGAWLFNYGIGIHLLESESVPSKKEKINPKDNHISFQCSDMEQVIRKLEAMKIEYVTAVVEEGGIQVDQLFFHDPDGYMIEICNCQNLPVLPLTSCPLKLPSSSSSNTAVPSFYGKRSRETPCSAVAAVMMENLLLDMLDISF
ncbi:metallothiol transferase FosB-like isoform X2 [Gossypium australe]|uniref:Metallothiol transferase FosB-like isoform X2 n=1 Tax=Gossypium australe TaxID=47621 RepID=A0A5B6WLM0_9ROSI|nr:metallothiol transferase FosB-like isoform X2 [Gossypium australe]